MAITDPAGRIRYVNDRFCEISKYAREELIGQDHRIVNSRHHSPEFWRGMWRTVSRGNVWRAEVCNRAKDGSLYWVETTIVPFKDNRGRITQHVAIRADITQRKAAKATLAEREQQFRTLVNNIPARSLPLSERRTPDHAVPGRRRGETDRVPGPSDFVHENSVPHVYERDLPSGRSLAHVASMGAGDAAGTSGVVPDGVPDRGPMAAPHGVRARSGGVPMKTTKTVRFFSGWKPSSTSTSLKHVEQELLRAARLDKLTGLPNRGLFLERLQVRDPRVPTARRTIIMR